MPTDIRTCARHGLSLSNVKTQYLSPHFDRTERTRACSTCTCTRHARIGSYTRVRAATRIAVPKRYERAWQNPSLSLSLSWDLSRKVPRRKRIFIYILMESKNDASRENLPGFPSRGTMRRRFATVRKASRLERVTPNGFGRTD